MSYDNSQVNLKNIALGSHPVINISRFGGYFHNWTDEDGNPLPKSEQKLYHKDVLDKVFNKNVINPDLRITNIDELDKLHNCKFKRNAYTHMITYNKNEAKKLFVKMKDLTKDPNDSKSDKVYTKPHTWQNALMDFAEKSTNVFAGGKSNKRINFIKMINKKKKCKCGIRLIKNRKKCAKCRK